VAGSPHDHVLAAAAALALVMAVPARAQPAPEREMPADALVPNEQAQHFFELLESGAVGEAELNANPVEMDEAMRDILAEMTTRGERVDGWQDRGVDLETIAAAREGGLAGNMTEEPGEFGVLRVYFVDRPLESVLAPELKLVGRYGPPLEGAGVTLEIGHFSPRLLLVMRAQYRPQGRADCLQRSETLIYSDPRIPATEADLIAFFVTRHLAGRFDALGICSVYEEREPGVFAELVFDDQGYRLPQMEDAQARFRIVPAAPFPAATPPNPPR
jgi:hypothetical protein